MFSFAYELPAWGLRWNDTAFGRKFFSGWQLSGVALTQGGTLLTITEGARLYGVTTSRGSWAQGATIETAQLSGSVKDRLNRFFNTAAFVPAGNVFGNTGRGILRGPGQKNLDISLGQMTPVTQRVKAEFRVEAFNVLNLTNFENPNTEISSSTFGQITGTSSNSRLILMGLRILY